MPIVNYVREHRRFIDYASDEQLTSGERLLWYALMEIMNQRAQGRDWPEGFIRISNERVLALCGIKYDAMAAARNKLKQRGRIDFISGKGSEKGSVKAVSPLYRMIYFFPEVIPSETPYHTEKTDGMGYGQGGGLGDGSQYGQGGGLGDINININENKHKPEQTEAEEDNPTTEEDALARVKKLYPKRQGPLSPRDESTLMRLRVWLDGSVNVRRMFGEGMAIIEALLDSDRYPVELVGYAIEKTVERDAKYEIPLGNPIAYTQKLLEDWRSRGVTTIEEIQEAKDDWGHYA